MILLLRANDEKRYELRVFWKHWRQAHGRLSRTPSSLSCEERLPCRASDGFEELEGRRFAMNQTAFGEEGERPDTFLISKPRADFGAVKQR